MIIVKSFSDLHRYRLFDCFRHCRYDLPYQLRILHKCRTFAVPLTTFGTGHPILMSRIWNGSSSIIFAISLMIFPDQNQRAGTIQDVQPDEWSSDPRYFYFYTEGLALTISIQISPAPCSLQRTRNGRSVTPAIGASTSGFCISTFPIFSGDIVWSIRYYFPSGFSPSSSANASSGTSSPRKKTR